MARATVSGCVTTARLPTQPVIRAYVDASHASLGDQTQWVPLTSSKTLNILCLSGGGSGGAFTVGALSAWGDKHPFPVFDVTGVSKGALAPYAFLGSAYDTELPKFYTGGQAKKLVDARWMG